MYNDGTRSRKGQTRQFNKACLEKFYSEIYGMCPLHRYETSTIYKHGMPAIAAHMYYSMNNAMGQGYCAFHWTNIPANQLSTCTNDDIYVRSIGVPLGHKYIWYPKTLPVSFTGDAGPVKNTKKGISSMCLAFLKVLGYVQGVTHSLYSGICVLVSSLSESSSELQSIVQIIGSSIPQSSAIAIHCPHLNTFVLLSSLLLYVISLS